MFKNHLKIIVMNKLKGKGMSGYDLIKEIHNSTGSWKPSFGTMYPLLKELHAKGLVSVQDVNRKKVYSLTVLGKRSLEDALNASQDSINMLMREFKIMESIYSPHDKKHIEYVLKKLQNQEAVFGGISDEIDGLQRVIVKLLAGNKIKRKEKEIKIVLSDTISKLKKIESA